MVDFLRFLNKILEDFPLHVEITYNKTAERASYSSKNYKYSL